MRKLHLLAQAVLMGFVLASPRVWAADEIKPYHRPVKEVGSLRLAVGAQSVLPLYISADWSNPLPDITRAVVVVHGVGRTADVYFRSAQKAQAAAGEAGKTAIMIAPQFLAEVDVDAHNLAPDTLRWTVLGWEAGYPAAGPATVSSFDAMDAILAKLADRRLFPNLSQVVVAGHSGGAQLVQRYAIAAKGEAALTQAGIGVRYVVADPSAYAYFSHDRPEPSIAATCTGFDNWRYGMEKRPPYLADPTVAALEQAYVARRVIYLLGTLDNDPNHLSLDKSCMAEAQGPNRYARGHAYAAAMQARNAGAPNHSVWDVPDVGHFGAKMFTSRCGLEALFDVSGCEAAH
jgi:pimeloyl-ACP methyl ester carboxylesterase